MHTTTGIYWLKRDFRFHDNPALTHCLAQHQKVIMLFLLEDEWLYAPETSAFHIQAVFGALEEMRTHIRPLGSDLLLLKGNALESLAELYHHTQFTHLYSHEEVGTERTYARDRAVMKWCNDTGIIWEELIQTGVFRRLSNRNDREKLWKKFMNEPVIPTPSTFDLQQVFLPDTLLTHPLRYQEVLTLSKFGYELPAEVAANDAELDTKIQAVTEQHAQQTLHNFLNQRGVSYKGGISSPNHALMAGSRLSAHLAWGTISPRQVYADTVAKMQELAINDSPNSGKWRASLRSFLSRIHWRDHFMQRLETETIMEFSPLNPAYKNLQYDNDPYLLKAWQTGQTGFPMVDACIRCLNTIGFINFRMRAMLTSMACHTLHLDWRLINHPMALMYTDYEPGIHLSQLQMQAGVVGINILRVYSPHKQLLDQDPDTVFVKKWIPELREFTAQQIRDHRYEPLGEYPAQVVNWKEASSEMARRVYAIRRTAEFKEIAKKVYEKHGSRKFRGERRQKTTNKSI